MATRVSPGVSVSVVDQSTYVSTVPQTIPLIVMATRANKTNSNGNIATGTTESNKLRLLTSQRDLLVNYGVPSFVTSGGNPVYGDETNELGLFGAYTFLGSGSRAYVIRADVDLGQLLPSTSEPVLAPTDGTFWIDSSAVVGGIFKYDGANWNAVPFSVYTTSPTASDGNDGDWAFDYSTMNGTIRYKNAGTWKAASNANLAADFGATINLHVSSTAPTGPNTGDYWYKTTKSGNGTDLAISRYRAVDGTFVVLPIIRQSSAPTPSDGIIWEDTSAIASSGNRPIYVGTGTSFTPVPAYVQSTPPSTAPETGTYWYDDSHSDFAMYVEGTDLGRGNEWIPVTTTTSSSPSSTEKVISASAPLLPQEGAIWIDISTASNLDDYPIVKKYISGAWVDITSSIKITDSDPVASSVINGTYWINTSESKTRYIVKTYDPSYTAVKVELNTGTNKYETVTETGNHWKPATTSFGRKSVREVVVSKMQEAININEDIRSESIFYHLIAAPGYPELYDEMTRLNSDIGETAFILLDTPKFASMAVSTSATGRAVTVSDWISNARGVTATGEEGFASNGSPYAAAYYPWLTASNADGSTVFVPPSTQMMRVMSYNDTVSHPWYPPAGIQRGRADIASAVGYLDENENFVSLKLTPGQQDTLSVNNINPFLYKNNSLVVYGQKTLYGANTALDRINVARLVATIKRNVKESLAPFVFQLNNAGTRAAAKNLIDRYLAGIMARNGLYDYLTIVDQSNNTASVIDANEMVVDIFIKPAKSIEFISVSITIENTDATLGA